MVTLDYTFDPEGLTKLHDFNFAKLTGTDLDYHLYCGNIVFRVNGVSFDAAWKWIPVFDFCVRLNEAITQLQSRKRAVLEFTENEAIIEFESNGSFVFIRASYVRDVARVEFQELREAVRGFSEKLIRELSERWPAVVKTAPFEERLAIIRSSSGGLHAS
jgi:hypothetical protein